MARAKKAPVVKSVIIEGAPVIERAIVRFSHIVLQFTVENGDQISYEVLETLENPEVADAIEYATVRFSEVVCQFVVTDGTTVHAYELEPVYQEIGGGPTPPVVKYHDGAGVSTTHGGDYATTKRLATDYIPYDTANNTLSAAFTVNSYSGCFSAMAYDENKAFLSAYSTWANSVVSPALDGGWAKANGTVYTLRFGPEVKYIRMTLAALGNLTTDIDTAEGTVTASGVEYTLEKEA